MTAERIILWRHARTAFNHGNRFQGQLDAPLDETGRQQARESAAAIAGLLGAEPVVRVVTSDLSRAADTATTLCVLLGVKAETDPDLREVHGGDWQGLFADEIHARWPEEYATWLGGDETLRTGITGETRAEAAARTAAAIERHGEATDGGTLVVASHGAALRGALLELLGLAPATAGAFGVLENAHWSQLTRRRDRWVLRSWNVGVTPTPPPPLPGDPPT